MGPEGLLSHLQETSCPFSEPDRSSSCSGFHLSKIHFNIILQSTSGSLKWSPSLKFSHQIPLIYNKYNEIND